jgi:hypothetical protein
VLASPNAASNAVPSMAGFPNDNRRINTSSLHRAVMERLEVQKAMNDLAGQTLPSVSRKPEKN